MSKLMAFDFRCDSCGVVKESLQYPSTTRTRCDCGKMAYRVIAMSGVHCGNMDDTTWAQSAREVMPKDSQHPETQAFMRNPTKGNLKRAMKAEGIRHMEPGERMDRAPKFDAAKHSEHVAKRFMGRSRVELRD